MYISGKRSEEEKEHSEEQKEHSPSEGADGKLQRFIWDPGGLLNNYRGSS
jgi:hypothetical protein